MKNQAKLTARWIYAFLILVAVVALWYVFREKDVTVDVAPVTKGLFEGTLQVDGTIRSRTKTTVTAYAEGDLNRVEWKVGDLIAKDDVVAVLSWDLKKPIKSPVTGVISKVHRESAGPIQRGAPIIDIIDPASLEVVAKILTTDAVQIPEGAPVNIGGFGQDNRTLQGKVRNVSRAGFTEISALGIEEEKTEVRIDFNEPPPQPLGDNFHVDLAIHLSRQEDVLLVPVSALFKNQNQWAVYKVIDKRARLTVVGIEKRNNTVAWLTSGLQENDVVVLFPSDQVFEGVHLRFRYFSH